MEAKQKKVIIASGILVFCLVILIIFLAWYKNNLGLFAPATPPATTDKTDTVNLETETETEKTEKQILIEQISPNTDLDEFDLPETLLNEIILADERISPAFNRQGRIIGIDKEKSIISFLNMTFEEKIYEVKITNETDIQVNNIYEKADQVGPAEIKTVPGTINDLRIDDNVSIKAQQKINSDSFTALEIETTHFLTK